MTRGPCGNKRPGFGIIKIKTFDKHVMNAYFFGPFLKQGASHF